MIKRNDDIEIHTVKPFRPPPEYITCPLCRRNVQSQAIGGHLNFKHNIKGVSLDDLKTMTLRGTAKKILGDLEIEGKKRLLDEALYTAENGPGKEAESVSPGDPPDDPGGPPGPGDPPDDPGDPPDDPGGPKNERRKINLYPPSSPFNRRERE